MSTPAPEPALARGAGFWKREVAWLIDALLVGALVNVVLSLPLGLLGVLGGASSTALLGDTWNALSGGAGAEALQPLLRPLLSLLAIAVALATALYALFGWIYFGWMESSPRQATLGKQALGIRVVDRAGARISFARASARFFAAALSWLTLNLGHALAAWTRERRALHDYLAGTRVVDADPASAALPDWARVLVALQLAVAGALLLLPLLLLAALLLVGGAASF